MQEKLFDVGFDDNLGSTYLHFLGQQSSESFMEGHRVLLDIYKMHGKGFHYTDIRSMGVISTDAQEYVAEKIVPQMASFNSGKVFIALWMSNDVFANFAAKSISGRVTAYSEVKFFKEREEMINWFQGLKS